MRMLLEMGLSNAVVATILALPVAAISLLCRRPALTHSLWLLVLLKLVTPPLVSLPEDWLPSWQPSILASTVPILAEEPASAFQQELAAAAGTESDQGESTLPSVLSPTQTGAAECSIATDAADPVAPLVARTGGDTGLLEPAAFAFRPFLLLWPIGSVVWFLWAVLHIVRFQRLLRHAKPAPVELRNQLGFLSRRLGLRRFPGIWLLPGAVSPMVWSIAGCPRLLFPAKLLDRLDAEQRATLLTHELAHIRRRDHWVRALEFVVSGLYWWHPLVWWARRELHEAEEQCCDAWVVGALQGASRPYALALLKTVAFFSNVRSALPQTASGIGQVPHLRRRLTMIMNGKTPRSLSWTGCLVVLGLAAMLLPLSALQAQTGPQPREVDKSGAKDDRDQQIEQLKKALKILEDLKRAEKAQGTSTRTADGDDLPRKAKEEAQRAKEIDEAKMAKDREEAQRIKQAIRELAQQVEVKRAELRALEAKLKEAMGRIGELERGPTGGKMSGAGAGSGAGGGPRIENRRGDDNQPRAKTPADLEQKLERILREVEDLKKEIRRENPKPSRPEQGRFETPERPGQLTVPTPITPAASAPSASPATPSPRGPSDTRPGISPRNTDPSSAAPAAPQPSTPETTRVR